MNIKMLITTLAILGSSSVAMARPITYSASAEASWSWGTRPVIRDHRVPAPIVRPAPVRTSFDQRNWNTYDSNRYDDRYEDSRIRYYEPRALVLEDGVQFEDHEYRKDIVMGATTERFNTLRFDASGGNTFLMKVVIEFADGGAVQQIDLNRTLRGNQSMSIDLSGSNRQMHRILIYRADGGEALNMNKRHNGEFTVSAL